MRLCAWASFDGACNTVFIGEYIAKTLQGVRPGVWRRTPGIVTYLWGALAVTVPILGSLLCILLYPRLVQPREGRHRAAPQPA